MITNWVYIGIFLVVSVVVPLVAVLLPVFIAPKKPSARKEEIYECGIETKGNIPWQARIWLAQGKLDAASQWVAEQGLGASEGPTYPQEMPCILVARILIARRQLDDATILLQRLLKAAEAGGRTSRSCRPAPTK